MRTRSHGRGGYVIDRAMVKKFLEVVGRRGTVPNINGRNFIPFGTQMNASLYCVENSSPVERISEMRLNVM
ncbi:hypothetical protein WAI453_012541 [Rhynchosporium graminicola]